MVKKILGKTPGILHILIESSSQLAEMVKEEQNVVFKSKVIPRYKIEMIMESELQGIL